MANYSFATVTLVENKFCLGNDKSGNAYYYFYDENLITTKLIPALLGSYMFSESGLFALIEGLLFYYAYNNKKELRFLIQYFVEYLHYKYPFVWSIKYRQVCVRQTAG